MAWKPTKAMAVPIGCRKRQRWGAAHPPIFATCFDLRPEQASWMEPAVRSCGSSVRENFAIPPAFLARFRIVQTGAQLHLIAPATTTRPRPGGRGGALGPPGAARRRDRRRRPPADRPAAASPEHGLVQDLVPEPHVIGADGRAAVLVLGAAVVSVTVRTLPWQTAPDRHPGSSSAADAARSAEPHRVAPRPATVLANARPRELKILVSGPSPGGRARFTACGASALRFPARAASARVPGRRARVATAH